MRTWLKAKYRRTKPVGSYKSKHNDGTRRRSTPRRKLPDKIKVEIQATQPKVTLVLLPTGKRRFVREDENTRTPGESSAR